MMCFLFINKGVAVVGAGWYLSRLARGPDVTWDRLVLYFCLTSERECGFH